MLGRHRIDFTTALVGGLGEVPLATHGGRIVARLLDFAIVFLPSYFVLGVIFVDSFGTVLGILVAELVVYDTLLRTTPGKRLMRIRVVQMRTGAAPGLARAFVRGLFSVTAGVLPAITVLFDERTFRGWHDRLAGTVVIAE